MEKHSVSISGRLYADIKDYCDFNGLRVNAFVEELLGKAFTVEKFGDRPFSKVAVDPGDEEGDHTSVAIISPDGRMVRHEVDKEAEELMGEIVESVGGPDKYADAINELIYGPDEKTEEPAKVAEVVPQKEEKPAEEVPQKPKKKVTRLN